MATEKKITSRIQQKHDVAANWAKATNFIPKKGEIIIYDAEYNASGEETQAVRFKIGDGTRTVNNLPFAVIDYSSDIETLEQKVANNSTAIGALQENTVPKTRKINNKALSSDITLGAADVGVNETTFPGLKKTGTVTGVKMNGTTKNPSSGVVDLGTVITAHQSLDGKQDKITSSNKLSSSLIDGLGAAAGKAVDTVISANSTSTNLPTSKAVEDRINAHSGIDKVGTVTGVKMNGTTKTPSSGVVDLGTVLTDASKFATSAQGTKADNAMPKSGGAFTGNISVPKTITFADTTNPYIKMTTGGTDFYFQSTSGQFGLGPTWDKATHWDSNGNVTFPTVPKVGNSSLALKSDIPSAVTESTVSGWGFTKNKGTVTSVAVKMNGSEKGTVTSSGTIDLGTVITSHQGIKKLNTDHTTAQSVNASEYIESDILTYDNTIHLHKIAKTGSYNDLNYKHVNFIGGSFVDFETFATDTLVTIDPSLFDPAPNEEDIALVPATLNGANPSIVCCYLLGDDQWVIKGVSYAFPSGGGGTTLNKYTVLARAINNINTLATLLYKIVTTAKSYRVYDQAQAGSRQIAVGYTVAVPDMTDISNPGAIITLYQQTTIARTKHMSLIYNTATHDTTFSGTLREYTIGTGGTVTAKDNTLRATELQYIVIEYWNETEITA